MLRWFVLMYRTKLRRDLTKLRSVTAVKTLIRVDCHETAHITFLDCDAHTFRFVACRKAMPFWCLDTRVLRGMHAMGTLSQPPCACMCCLEAWENGLSEPDFRFAPSFSRWGGHAFRAPLRRARPDRRGLKASHVARGTREFARCDGMTRVQPARRVGTARAQLIAPALRSVASRRMVVLLGEPSGWTTRLRGASGFAPGSR